MMSEYTLIQKGTLWEFSRESEFEDYLWENLEVLLGVKPIKRQYYSKGNFCDILAVTSQKELAILELKVTEDRYIVQQLTRYYHSLYQERPFSDDIDFNKPVKLIAILPKIHSDNLIDAIYSKLNINFITYNLSEESEKLYLSLIDHVSQLQISKTEIRLKASEYDDGELPKIPSKLIKILSQSSQEEKAKILAIRGKVLRFNKKINESISASSIIYGCGKTKPIMEIRIDPIRNKPALFLWLPLPGSEFGSYNKRRTLLRIKIWTDWGKIFYLGYIRKGNGIMISLEEYKTFPTKLIPASLLPDQYSRDRFESDTIFRESFIDTKITDIKHARKYTTGQRHSDPLALEINDYIKIILQLSEFKSDFISSKVLDLSKYEFSLDEFINFALHERLMT